jgi:DNA-binding NtrC family response regulator
MRIDICILRGLHQAMDRPSAAPRRTTALSFVTLGTSGTCPQSTGTRAVFRRVVPPGWRSIVPRRVDPPTLPPSAGSDGGLGTGERVPGVVVVFSGGAPSARFLPLESGALVLGRREGSTGKLDDGRVSRRHARVELRDGRWIVTDLSSQNGTVVDGELAAAHVPTVMHCVIRMGDTLLVPCADGRALGRTGVRDLDGFVRGPAMQAILDEVVEVAGSGGALHIRGESGTGKEGVAQVFHRAGPRAARPLVPVNCAAIPHALAERLLFGARRGAYSGADTDAVGYLQEADGGTVFLDEVAELDLQVQAKLLRVLESGEVVPLGASKPRRVDFALCSATSKDLRALVAAGTWREDLYFRIARPAVTLPALRDRPEEIPALIAHELARLPPPAPSAHSSFVERCLLRPWPGNARELLAEVRAAARAPRGSGNRLTARHLADTAGSVFSAAALNVPAAAPDRDTPPPDPPQKRTPRIDVAWRQRIEDALRANAGNVTATARALGLHRNQMRRLLERHGIAAAAGSLTEDEATE